MDVKGFRIIADFSEFFSDERRKSYVYIEHVREKTVFDLQCRIKKLFGIKCGISLLANDCFLHPQECVSVLYEEDVVKVIQSGSAVRNEVVEEVDSKHEDYPLKRKRDKGNESAKADDSPSNQRKRKMKNSEKHETLQYVDRDKMSTNKFSMQLLGENNLPNGIGVDVHMDSDIVNNASGHIHKKKNKKRKADRKEIRGTEITEEEAKTEESAENNLLKKTNGIDVTLPMERDVFDNDSGHFPKNKIKKKKDWKGMSDTENTIEEVQTEGSPNHFNIISVYQLSPVMNHSKDSGVAGSQEGTTESQSIQDCVSSAQSVESSQVESGSKKKRRRRHKKKKDASEVNEFTSVTFDFSLPNYEVRGFSGAGKHIKFADDVEEEREQGGEKKDDSTVLQGEKLPTHSENLSSCEGGVVSQPDKSEEIFNRINAFIQQRRECNGDVSLNGAPQQEPSKHANNAHCTLWDVQSAEDSQLFNGILNRKKTSTPLVFECKRPAVTPRPHTPNESQCHRSGVKDYTMYPILQGLPKENDVLGFKVWKLGEDYSPGISDYIVGKVLSFSEPEKYIKLKILYGHAELKQPEGKFSIKRPPEGESEDEDAVIEVEEEPLIDELETTLGEMFEVRLLFP